MMKNLWEKTKALRVIIISCLIVLVVGMVGIFVFIKLQKSITIETYENDTYVVKYDTTWKIDKKSDNGIDLIHNKDGKISVKIVPLEDEYVYCTCESLVDEVLHSLQKQNKKYKLISKEKSSFSKYNYDGYKMLYENEDNQVLVTLGKKADKLLVATYEANDSSFDILLDSAQNILYDFQILDGKFKLAHKLNIKTGKLQWDKNSEIKDVKKVNEYEMSENNYKIDYAVPKCFIKTDIDSRWGSFKKEDFKKGYIEIEAYSRKINMYDYLDKECTTSLYSNYTGHRSDKKEYKDFKEGLEKADKNKKYKYLYKNSYFWETEYFKHNMEEAVVIYEIDVNHLVLFEIKASDQKISQELIDSLKIKNIRPYSKYVLNKKSDDKLIGTLKDSYWEDDKVIRETTLKLPDDYEEIDMNTNFYEERYYGKGYNDKTEIYAYNVNYKLYNSEDIAISVLDSSYNSRKNYKKLTYKTNVTIGGRVFKVYRASYSQEFNPFIKNLEKDLYDVDVVILTYEYDENCCLAIEMKGNDQKVSQQMIDELVNIEINEKK